MKHLGGWFEVDDPCILCNPAGGRPDDFISTGLMENKVHNEKWLNTRKLSEIDPGEYVGVWLVGGYGAAFEFADDPDIPRIVESIWNAGGVMGSICHGAPGLLCAKGTAGQYLIKDRELTGFSKAEDQEVEKAVGFPFLKFYVKDELRARGAVTNGVDCFSHSQSLRRTADWLPDNSNSPARCSAKECSKRSKESGQ